MGLYEEAPSRVLALRKSAEGARRGSRWRTRAELRIAYRLYRKARGNPFLRARLLKTQGKGSRGPARDRLALAVLQHCFPNEMPQKRSRYAAAFAWAFANGLNAKEFEARLSDGGVDGILKEATGNLVSAEIKVAKAALKTASVGKIHLDLAAAGVTDTARWVLLLGRIKGNGTGYVHHAFADSAVVGRAILNATVARASRRFGAGK